MAEPCRHLRTTQFTAGETLALHRHDTGYLALVLDGAYEEASADGRYYCGASSIVWHPPYHMHKNHFAGDGAIVINLPAPPIAKGHMDYRIRSGADVTSIVTLAETNIEAAAAAAFEELALPMPEAMTAPAWLVSLAAALRKDSHIGASSLIGALARREGVSPEHATRRFKDHFGVSPVAYRREHRIRRALDLIRSGTRAADAACRCGYADQSHFVRECRQVTGRTPGAFRFH